MKVVYRVTIAFTGLLLALPVVVRAELISKQKAKLPLAADRKVSFSKDIYPLLERSCAKCHGKGKAKGGFSLETRKQFLAGGDTGTTVVVGNSAGSYLIELVSGIDPDNVMPQKGSKFTPEQVGLLRAWIDQGLQ
ncbi:MAG: c-type cytochrome domain-containing protein, partial [Verrucomicrobiota bacterium]|nr:c-type cytochrome domain-containing protein [Verrucomicrobiota bacterium]